MAHADYDCCAICDCKMSYNSSEPKTKESLCEECLERINSMGIHVYKLDQVKSLLLRMTNELALEFLHKLHFSPCYYPNPFDQYLIDRGLILTDIPRESTVHTKWGKMLKPLPTPPGGKDGHG